MPRATILANRPMTPAEKQARYRARKKARAAEEAQQQTLLNAASIKHPGRELASWARDNLKIPFGHKAAGQPFMLPEYLIAFLDDAATHRESLLCIARKNAKSAAVAVYALARLAGPLIVPGWRGGCLSISKEKAAELKLQMEKIVEASLLQGVRFWKSPAPGHVTGLHDTRFDILCEGHATGLDDAMIDELGLLKEKDREAVSSMRSSVSAKDGRFISLTIRGSGPFVPEILKREGEPGLAVHHYTAPEDCALDDREAWKAANPGLGIIKSEAYMKAEAARVSVTPADEASFRGLDLNLPLEASHEIILSPADLRTHLFTNKPPQRMGAAIIAFDFGEAKSATAAFAIWPATGRCEAWMAFGDNPSIEKRSKADNSPYVEMVKRGELKLYPGRITPVTEFLKDVAADLEGTPILHCACDQYKRAEAQDFLDKSTGWMLTNAEGSQGHAKDVRSLTRLIQGGKLKMKTNLPLVTAIAKHMAKRDQAGNPKINKAQAKGRIDVLSAALIAAGLSEKYIDAGSYGEVPEPMLVIV